MRLLAVRPHSEVELRRKLVRRGCDAEAVGAALGRCRELGYLDDEAYARALVRRRSPARGSVAIAAELASKGIGRELARSLLQDEGGAEVELEAAVRLLARAAPSAADRAKLSGKLQRRGFSPEVVRRAWRRLQMLDEDLTEV